MIREPSIPPACQDRPAPPRAPVRRRVVLLLSALLHAAVLAVLLLTPPRPAPEGAGSEPSYDVVFTDEPKPDEPERVLPTPTEPPDPDATELVLPQVALPPGMPPEAEAAPDRSSAPVPPEVSAPATTGPELPPSAPPDPAAEPVPPPRPVGPPQVRLTEPLLTIPPVPVPWLPAPPDPDVSPARPPRPRTQQQAGTLGAPMDLNFGPAPTRRPPPGSAASRAIDLTVSSPKPASPSAVASNLRSFGASTPLELALQRQWILHRYYPREAVVNEEEGTVVIQMHVDSSGKIRSVGLMRSSGSRALDTAAVRTFRDVQLKLPLGAADDSQTVDMEITYAIIRERGWSGRWESNPHQ